MLRFSTAAGAPDPARARTYLTELQTSFPDEHRMEVSAVSGLLDELASADTRARDALAAGQAELESMKAALQQQLAAAEKATASARETVKHQVQVLQNDLASARRELTEALQNLEAARAEVKQKDEAMKRLTQRALNPG
jgi:hypothetical protein